MQRIHVFRLAWILVMIIYSIYKHFRYAQFKHAPDIMEIRLKETWKWHRICVRELEGYQKTECSTWVGWILKFSNKKRVSSVCLAATWSKRGRYSSKGCGLNPLKLSRESIGITGLLGWYANLGCCGLLGHVAITCTVLTCALAGQLGCAELHPVC